MKNTLQIILAVLLITCAFTASADTGETGLISIQRIARDELSIEKLTYVQPMSGECTPEPSGGDAKPPEQGDAEYINVYYKAENKSVMMDMREYLIGVLAAEMPAYYNIEALKAQAVAARTYFYSRSTNGGCKRYEACDICTYSGHCQGYLSKQQRKDRWGKNFEDNEAKLGKAVDDTWGIYLTYDGEIISAMYHDSSLGSTEDYASRYGGTERAYLQSVSTPDDKESVTRRVIVKIEDFVRLVNQKYPLAHMTSRNIGTDLKIVERTKSGRVESVKIGSEVISGSEFQSIAKLRSTQYHIKIAADSIIFITAGYGHGIGMSQVGANAMAKSGSTYREILLHYYSGVKLEK